MMISATSFGLGSCYIGFGSMVKASPEVVGVLELKENEQIYGSILVGYPKNETTAAVSDALERVCAIKRASN
jgi:nitroreductase